MCSTIWRPRNCVYPSVFIPSLLSIRHPKLGSTVCISPKENSQKVCLHLPAADITQLDTMQLDYHVPWSWSVLRPDYSKVSCCQNIMSISVSLWGRGMKGIITSPLKASVRFPLQRDIVQLASEGSTVFFIEVVCVCKACLSPCLSVQRE